MFKTVIAVPHIETLNTVFGHLGSFVDRANLRDPQTTSEKAA